MTRRRWVLAWVEMVNWFASAARRRRVYERAYERGLVTRGYYMDE